MGAVSVPSRVLMGVLSDRAGRKTIGVVCALLHTVALLWLIGSTEMWMFYIFAVLYGMAYGGIDPPVAALIGDHFGMRRVGIIMGSLTAGWCAGAALGPYIAGYIYDVSSSYTAAFATGSFFIAVAALAISRLGTPKEIRRRPEKP
jgi:MFS family permease